MHLVHTVSHVGHEASGPSYSVPRLCEALGAGGHDVLLLTLERGEPRSSPYFRHAAHRAGLPGGLGGVSGGLRRALLEALQTADVMHNHGLWLMPNVYPALAARRAGKPLMVSPRGTLSPMALARSSWRKKVFWQLFQARAVRGAQCLHATSEQEFRDIRAFGLSLPVAVIPNGIDLPPRAASVKSDGPRRLLFLGRIHPIKGLETLLQAWRNVGARFLDWELRLVGPGSGNYVAKLLRLSAELGLERVVFAGERYGEHKAQEYAAAELYVLPSFTENFGMSVAEALAQGVPVVTTTGTPWKGLQDRGCGWWVPPDAASLERSLGEALGKSPAQLSRMGETGRAWMESDYAWERVAREMGEVYRWMVQGGTLPDTVRTS